jgi:SET domain-containing protein
MKEHLMIKQSERGEKGVFVNRDFKDKEVVWKLEGTITPRPTRHSIEIGDTEHILDEFGAYLNHSCEPNTKIKRKEKEVRALRNINSGEELTFDYNSNETEMAEPFQCKCGSKNCQGLISGRKRKR